MKIIEPTHQEICNFMRDSGHCSRCGATKRRTYDQICNQCFEDGFHRWKECYANAKKTLTKYEYTPEELAQQKAAHKRGADINAKAMQELSESLREFLFD